MDDSHWSRDGSQTVQWSSSHWVLSSATEQWAVWLQEIRQTQNQTTTPVFALHTSTHRTGETAGIKMDKMDKAFEIVASAALISCICWYHKSINIERDQSDWFNLRPNFIFIKETNRNIACCHLPLPLFWLFLACMPNDSPSSETSAHSGLGNSYWPSLILCFMPGEMAWPVFE